MKTAALYRAHPGTPLVARLHVDLCRCTSAACCR
ncbi:putative leader peptide [Streptomyces sp. NPDC051219]